MKLFSLLIFILLSSSAIAHPHSKDSIHFDYTFEKSENMKEIIQVNATITNHSSRHFYFLSQSCNGLDYYITTTSPKATIFIFIHCNASFGRKMILAPKGTYEFITRIQCIGKLEKVGLNLTLTQVSKTYVDDEKFSSKNDKEKKMNPLLLSGPVQPIPK